MSKGNGKNGKGATDRTRTPRRGKPAEQWRARFLEGLRATFNVEYACGIASVSRDTAYRERRKDESFAKEWEEAREKGLDTLRPLLEENNLHIAIHGEREPLMYQGQQVRGADGELMYKITRYPVLAMFFLERLLTTRYFVKPQAGAPPDLQGLAEAMAGLLTQARWSVQPPPSNGHVAPRVEANVAVS